MIAIFLIFFWYLLKCVREILFLHIDKAIPTLLLNYRVFLFLKNGKIDLYHIHTI